MWLAKHGGSTGSAALSARALSTRALSAPRLSVPSESTTAAFLSLPREQETEKIATTVMAVVTIFLVILPLRLCNACVAAGPLFLRYRGWKRTSHSAR